jgi:D-inositol-3-phosphate glycosyltransferase
MSRRTEPGYDNKSRELRCASARDLRHRLSAAACDGNVRIAVVCHYLPPHVGGIEHVVDHLAREYCAAGHEVTVLGFRLAGQPCVPAPYRSVPLIGTNAIERFGIPVPILEPVSSWRRLSAVLRDTDAVHVHGITQMASVMAMEGARRAGLPVVVTEHVGAIPIEGRALREVQDVSLRFGGHVVRRTARAVVVLNDRVAAEIEPLVAPVPVVKVPNGVDENLFRPARRGERDELRAKWRLKGPTVLAVARHVPKKGLGSVVKAAEKDRALDAVLVGLGTESLDSSDGHCRGLGLLPQEDVAELYRAADLFVLPSRGEGLPLVVLEALASGLPVLLGDDPALRAELPYGPVRYVEPDGTGLVDSIHAILKDADELATLRLTARREAVARFHSWAAVADTYLGLHDPDKAGRPGT